MLGQTYCKELLKRKILRKTIYLLLHPKLAYASVFGLNIFLVKFGISSSSKLLINLLFLEICKFSFF